MKHTRFLTIFLAAGAVLLALLDMGPSAGDMALGLLLGLAGAIPLALLVNLAMKRRDGPATETQPANDAAGREVAR